MRIHQALILPFTLLLCSCIAPAFKPIPLISYDSTVTTSARDVLSRDLVDALDLLQNCGYLNDRFHDEWLELFEVESEVAFTRESANVIGQYCAAAVPGASKIYLGPNFFDSTRCPGSVNILAHEVLHIVGFTHSSFEFDVVYEQCVDNSGMLRPMLEKSTTRGLYR